ncbi:16S rRNA m5C967 methyltransferase [Pseudoclavibacter endophyticus]|uniref:rRNA small subunit methyltransferase B n=1 Tax=Pseudoclavibacter endophyticus TaxID=1778590 RepID=A0A6H9WPP5_9MICO|nr:transcription antitermination factor NusB [Pseudoclavibacter endophyticus]KAB1650098.1 rRNA small subunit methyltransferase B [Pseudoclavibacter endophyticus]GGA57232.1 16S rRNA m5C967 methyltransferase [Pseudoclavibacter endophyticus]
MAYDVLRAVQRDDAYANLLLPTRLRDAGMHGPDAALATELTYGTLRMLGYYDAVIEVAAGRSTDDIDAPVLDVLRLGAHQLLDMRLATHAAVHETVELTREIGARGASGFVNAVLRTMTRTDADAWPDVASKGMTGEDRLSVRTSHPAWIVRAIRESLEAEGRGDELEAALEADNASPTVSLAVLPGFADRDDVVAGADGTLHEGELSPVALKLERGNPAMIPGVDRGHVRVQDEGSQLVALALAAAAPISAGERWLDLCAGPGGKTALLAAAAAPDATVEANEPVPARARLVRRSVEPLGLGVDVSELDGREIGRERPARYDRVLVDAPCTGLGALRRRPEARWRKTPADVAELTALQEDLLDAAVAALVPGGVVAYVTCSPHLAETTSIVRRAVRRRGLEVLDAARVVADVCSTPGVDLPERSLEGGSTVQLWPHRYGTDAMFLALLRRPARS